MDRRTRFSADLKGAEPLSFQQESSTAGARVIAEWLMTRYQCIVVPLPSLALPLTEKEQEMARRSLVERASAALLPTQGQPNPWRGVYAQLRPHAGPLCMDISSGRLASSSDESWVAALVGSVVNPGACAAMGTVLAEALEEELESKNMREVWKYLWLRKSALEPFSGDMHWSVELLQKLRLAAFRREYHAAIPMLVECIESIDRAMAPLGDEAGYWRSLARHTSTFVQAFADVSIELEAMEILPVHHPSLEKSAKPEWTTGLHMALGQLDWMAREKYNFERLTKEQKELRPAPLMDSHPELWGESVGKICSMLSPSSHPAHALESQGCSDLIGKLRERGMHKQASLFENELLQATVPKAPQKSTRAPRL